MSFNFSSIFSRSGSYDLLHSPDTRAPAPSSSEVNAPSSTEANTPPSSSRDAAPREKFTPTSIAPGNIVDGATEPSTSGMTTGPTSASVAPKSEPASQLGLIQLIEAAMAEAPASTPPGQLTVRTEDGQKRVTLYHLSDDGKLLPLGISGEELKQSCPREEYFGFKQEDIVDADGSDSKKPPRLSIRCDFLDNDNDGKSNHIATIRFNVKHPLTGLGVQATELLNELKQYFKKPSDDTERLIPREERVRAKREIMGVYNPEKNLFCTLSQHGKTPHHKLFNLSLNIAAGLM